MYSKTVGEKPVKQWLGIYKGIVVNNADPLGQQRIQAQVPQVLGTAVTTWASPLLPIGVAGPPTGTFIAVVFLGGDPDKPVYLNQTAAAVDWSLPNLVVGDPVVQQGTFTVYGANGTSPASNITGGLEVDTLTTTGNINIGGTAYGQIDAYQPGTVTPEVWHTMFGISGGIGSNGWTIASGYHAMFRLNANGNIELSGRIYASTTSAEALVVCQLPVGYYQTTSSGMSVPITCVNDGSFNTSQTFRISLSNTGSLTLAGQGTGGTGSSGITVGTGPGNSTTLSLDGVMFPISAG